MRRGKEVHSSDSIDHQKVLYWSVGRTRAAESVQRRVLDPAVRRRRQKKQLEVLEKDNAHEDPHNSLAQLSSKAKLPTFAETSDGTAGVMSYGCITFPRWILFRVYIRV